MKLVRYGEKGSESPGIWLKEGMPDGRPAIVDVRRSVFDIEDYNPSFFVKNGLLRLKYLLKEDSLHLIPAHTVRLGSPVAPSSSIICVGKNYAEHAKEFDGSVNAKPVLFQKANSSLQGPCDDIIIPNNEDHIDLEAELGVVIGSPCRHVTADEALTMVAGYTIINDITNRTAQKEDGQWFRAKSYDTFCPAGPYLVTSDEIADPSGLAISSAINGISLQKGHTSDMVVTPPELIAYISGLMTLRPGDIIATGTPAGVGFACKPPRRLEPEDTIEITIESLGTQRASIYL